MHFASSIARIIMGEIRFEEVCTNHRGVTKYKTYDEIQNSEGSKRPNWIAMIMLKHNTHTPCCDYAHAP